MNKKIVLLNGPIGSGKDFIADALVQTIGGVKKQFKEQLYVATAEFFGIGLEDFKTLAQDRALKEEPLPLLGCTRGQFLELHEYLGVAFFCAEERILLSGFTEYCFSPREAMIFVSELIQKPNFGDDVFGIAAAESMEEGFNYVSDSGFKEEAQVQIDTFGAENVLLVKIEREGATFEGDSRSYIDLPIPTLVLDNNRDISCVVGDILGFLLANWGYNLC